MFYCYRIWVHHWNHGSWKWILCSILSHLFAFPQRFRVSRSRDEQMWSRKTKWSCDQMIFQQCVKDRTIWQIGQCNSCNPDCQVHTNDLMVW
jgi:hypothetical protein